MADDTKNPALPMLLQLEARLSGLAEELQAVRGRLACVESRLARLAERDALLPPTVLTQHAIEFALDVTEMAPPLLPGEDEDALADMVRQIKARRTYVHVLSGEERAAIEAAWANGLPHARRGGPT